MHGKLKQTVFIHGNPEWSKTKQNIIRFGLVKFLPNWVRNEKQSTFILIETLLHTLASISHHKKSASISYNARSRQFYIFISFSPMYTNVVHFCPHFSVEKKLCFFLFSSFIQSIKKKLRQDASNRNPKRPRTGRCRVLIPLIADGKKVQPVALCLRHLTLGTRTKQWGWRGGFRGEQYLTSSRPVPLYESPKALLFGT